MEVGDLVKPRHELTFGAFGYAVITELNEGNVVIVWLEDQTDHYMRWWELEEQMEIVSCK